MQYDIIGLSESITITCLQTGIFNKNVKNGCWIDSARHLSHNLYYVN